MREEVVYLGFVISQNILEMDLKKVRTIMEWPIPKFIFELRSFHNLAYLYQIIIQSFSGICATLTQHA
jgi:hypothetical protein